MLAECSLFPLGGDPHISDELAEALRIVDDADVGPKLVQNITSVEEKLGRPLHHTISAMPEMNIARDLQ